MQQEREPVLLLELAKMSACAVGGAVVDDHELDAHRDGEHARNDLVDRLALVVHGHDHGEEGRLYGRPHPVAAAKWRGRFVHSRRLSAIVLGLA